MTRRLRLAICTLVIAACPGSGPGPWPKDASEDRGADARIDAVKDAGACDAWRVDLTEDPRGVAVFSDGRVVVVGNGAEDITVTLFDSCGAQLQQRTVTLADATKVQAGAVAVDGSSILVAGTFVPSSGADPNEGLLLRLAASDLSDDGRATLTGSAGTDEIWDLTVAGAEYWLLGSANIGAGSTILGVKVDSALASCTFKVLDGGGLGRGISSAGGQVYAVGGQGSAAAIARYAATGCPAASCGGACDPTWSMTFQHDSKATTPMAATEIDGKVYLTGMVTLADKDTQGIVVRIDPATSLVEKTYVWNPTTEMDGFLELAKDGADLVVVGGKDYAGDMDWEAASAVAHRLSLPDLELKSEISSGDRGTYADIAIAPGGFVLMGSLGSKGGYVRRCPSDGDCP